MRGYGLAMSRYATFDGRASRSEFWQFTLVVTAIVIITIILFRPAPGMSVWPLLAVILAVVAHVLPYLAVLARRFHDLDRTGWWALVGLIPALGLLALIPAGQPGTLGRNRFGEDPVDDRAEPRSSAAGKAKNRVDPAFGISLQAAPYEDPLQRLEKLALMRSNGTLSEGEFEVLKARLLGNAPVQGTLTSEQQSDVDNAQWLFWKVVRYIIIGSLALIAFAAIFQVGLILFLAATV